MLFRHTPCKMCKIQIFPVFDSPKTKTNFSDSNVAACKSRLEVIIKTIDDNFNKWQLAEKRGLALCSNIESIKTKALDKISSSENSNDFVTCYPDELNIYCTKLAIISSLFEDITRNAREALRQLQALRKLPGSCNEIFYRSWQLEEFIDFLRELLDRYEKEAKVKAHVAGKKFSHVYVSCHVCLCSFFKYKFSENLAHCTTRSDLIRCSTAWEYPQHVDSYVKLMFLFLREETNIKK